MCKKLKKIMAKYEWIDVEETTFFSLKTPYEKHQPIINQNSILDTNQ